MTSQFASMTSTSNFFEVSLFILSGLVTSPSFMSVSWLVLELWQFLFIKGWPKIQKSEIPPSESCPISWDWDKLGIPKLGQMFLIKFYWMLQNTRVNCFWVMKRNPTFWNCWIHVIIIFADLLINVLLQTCYKFCILHVILSWNLTLYVLAKKKNSLRTFQPQNRRNIRTASLK